MVSEEIELILAQAQQAALCNPPTLRNTYELAARAIREGVPGDFVECGVYAGAQLAAMGAAIIEAKSAPRVVIGLDSFEGIPEAGPQDDCQPGVGAIPLGVGAGELMSSGISVCSEEIVLRNWAQWGLQGKVSLALRKGWFQETAEDTASTLRHYGIGVALLRLDGDLYESTRICLEHFYPLLSPGGFCIVDDHALRGCRLAVEEHFLNERLNGRALPEVHEVKGGGGPVWWQKRGER